MGTASAPRGRATAALILAIGCAPDLDPELGEFVARGEHVEIWASEGLEVCGGNVELMDRFVERFREVVGPRPEAEAMHRYHVLDEAAWEEWADVGGCPGAAGGCTVARRTVYSRVGIPSLHELVHAEIYGEHDSYLEEGIAELYGCPTLAGRPDAGASAVVDGIDVRGAYIPRGDYVRAGDFTAFLVERHGIDGFLRVRDATSTTSDYASVARAFAAALGGTLDAELERYAGRAERCAGAGYRVSLVECELPVTPPRADGEHEVSLELTCDSPDVLGPFRGEIFGLAAIELDEPGVYDLRLEAPGTDEARAWITACDAGCSALRGAGGGLHEPTPAAVVVGAEPLSRTFHAGKHWLRLARPSEAPGSVTLGVRKRSEDGAEPTGGA